MYRLAVFTVAFVQITFAVSAANWEDQIKGLDGVTITCANANKEKYAARICDKSLKKIKSRFDKANIPAAVLGSYFVKTEKSPPKPDTMINPLNIVVFVRGTHSGGVLAIDMRSRIAVSYENAIEAGSDGRGRSGELLLWEGSTTGAGPRKGLPSAITEAAMKKLSKQLAEIVAAWTKNHQ